MPKKKPKKNGLQTLKDDLIKRLNKGKTLPVAYDLSDGESFVVKDFIPTGCWLLDHAITNKEDQGGFPSGRVIEVAGEYSVGKSLLAGTFIAEAQKLGGWGILVDSELSVEKTFLAETLGVNLEKFTLIQTKLLETAFEEVENAIGIIHEHYPDMPITVVYDSMAGLKSIEWRKLGKENDHNAIQMYEAKKLGVLLDEAVDVVMREKVCMVCVAQARDNIGGMSFGPKKKASSGNALKHYASVRVWLQKEKQIKKPNKDPEGIWIKAKIKKSNVGPPLKVIWFPIFFMTGIDDAQAELRYLLEKKLVKKNGQNMTISFVEEKEPRRVQTRQWPQFYSENRDQIRHVIFQSLIARRSVENTEDIESIETEEETDES